MIDWIIKLPDAIIGIVVAGSLLFSGERKKSKIFIKQSERPELLMALYLQVFLAVIMKVIWIK